MGGSREKGFIVGKKKGEIGKFVRQALPFPSPLRTSFLFYLQDRGLLGRQSSKGMSQNRPEEEEQKGKESRVEPTWARSDWRRGRGRTPQCVMSGKEKGEFPFLPPFSGRGRKEKQKRGQGLLLCRDWGPAAELKINQKLFFSLDFPFSFLDRPLWANVVFLRPNFCGGGGQEEKLSSSHLENRGKKLGEGADCFVRTFLCRLKRPSIWRVPDLDKSDFGN